VAVLILAFGLRTHFFYSNLLTEPDSYYHARIIQELIETGKIAEKDPLAYYQVGGSDRLAFTVIWPLSAFLYNVVYFGQGFDKEKLVALLKVLPIISGLILTALFYFFGREIFKSRKIGLAMALAFAIIPAIIYTTASGAFEDDAFGFIPMLLGLLFYFRAINTPTFGKKELKNSILAGLFFALMAITWKMAILVLVTLVPFFILFSLLISAKGNNKIAENCAKKSILSLLIFITLPLIFGVNLFSIFSTRVMIILGLKVDYLALLFIVLMACVIAYFVIKKIKYFSIQNKKRVVFAVVALLALIIIFELSAFIFINSLKSPFDVENHVEELAKGAPSFLKNFGVLIIFSIPLLIFGPLLVKRSIENKIEGNRNPAGKINAEHTAIVLYSFLLIALTLFLSWYVLKFSFALAFGLVFSIGVFANLIFSYLGQFKPANKKNLSKVALVFTFFIILLSMGWSFEFIKNIPPYLESKPEWVSATQWINENTAPRSKILNWWDQGHIITFLSERKVVTDNMNWPCPSCAPNKTVASFLVATDANKAYKIASIDLNADYVILYYDMFSKIQMFSDYANARINPSKQFSNQNNFLPCVRDETRVYCDSYTLSVSEYDVLPSKWEFVKPAGKKQYYIYRIYKGIQIIEGETNNTNFAKMWLNSRQTEEFYEEVYFSGGIKIFKILK